MTRLDWEGHQRKGRQRRAQQDAIRTKRPAAVVAWWLTFAGSPGSCSSCETSIARGQTVAYNHYEKRMVCEACIGPSGIRAQPSRKYVAEARRRKR